MTWPPVEKYYYCDDHACIIHGDCRDILPGLPPIDFCLTDPPYEAEAHTLQRRTRASVEKRVIDVALDFQPLTESMRKFICEIPCNWLLTFCQAEAVYKYQQMLGAKYRRAMVWIKPDGMPQYSGDRPGMGYESIVAAWCASGKSRWNGGGKHGVFKHNKCTGCIPGAHPTQKPGPLLIELIQLFSLGGLICDPFMGSGTTLRAAKDMGRKSIGIEIEEKYAEVAAKRLRQEVLPL